MDTGFLKGGQPVAHRATAMIGLRSTGCHRDLHMTLLLVLGMDHERLTYRHAGRDFRLTDVSGRVVKEIMA